jgi:hypothetical protein
MFINWFGVVSNEIFWHRLFFCDSILSNFPFWMADAICILASFSGRSGRQCVMTDASPHEITLRLWQRYRIAYAHVCRLVSRKLPVPVKQIEASGPIRRTFLLDISWSASHDHMKTVVWSCYGSLSVGAESNRTRYLVRDLTGLSLRCTLLAKRTAWSAVVLVMHNMSFMIESRQIENGVEKPDKYNSVTIRNDPFDREWHVQCGWFPQDGFWPL